MDNFSAQDADAFLGKPDAGTFDANSANEFLGPVSIPGEKPFLPPVPSTPERDSFLASTSVGRTLDAFGQGAKSGWGTGDLGISPETSEALKRAGVFGDAASGQRTILQAFNEGVIRPAAAVLDGAIRAGSAVIGGTEEGVKQAGEEAGVPGLGQTAAELIDFKTSGEPGVVHAPILAHEVAAQARVPLDLQAARDLGAVGQPESVYMGTQEPANKNAVDAARPVAETPPEPAAAAAPLPALVSETPPAPTDVHEAARAIAPDVFNEYDPLVQHVASLRQQIADARDALAKSFEAQAPNAAEIADLEARIQDTTPRLAKKYQARLDALTPDRDAFLADEDGRALATRDTPEIQAMRQELLLADYRMRDLAPDVTAAYAEAAKQFPVEEPAAESAAASEQPQPAVGAASAGLDPTKINADPTKIDQPEAALELARPAKGISSADSPLAPVSEIAADVSQKLQAAGRPVEEADAAGQVTKALYETHAARFEGRKGTAEDLYAREAPEIRAGKPARALELAQSGTTGARGKIRLTQDGRAVITLMKDANASTFLHETGHDWLERLTRDAADPEAPASLKADADTVRKYLGVQPGEAIPTKAHEKFARSFERYFMEGRAPSKALAGVFGQFRQWLTTIYQTVAKLRAPITSDIRDVFDRMLAVNPEREAAIVPERRAELFVPEPAAKAAEPVVEKVPRAPPRITAWVRKLGGVKDDGGEIRQMLGGKKLPGFLNEKTGMTLDDLTRRLWDDGYLPEFQERPSIQDMLRVLDDDLNDRSARYSEHDRAELEAFQQAAARSDEIERLADQHGIDPKGLTRAEFFAKIAESESIERQAADIRSLEEAHEKDYGDAADELNEYEDQRHAIALEPRTEQELDDAYGSEDSAGPAGQGAPDNAGGRAGVNEGAGEVGVRQGGRGAGDAGRDGEATRQQGSGAGVSGEPGAAGGKPLPPIDVKGEPPRFRTKDDDEVLKAANIRLDKINGGADMNAALMALAEKNADFLDARYGTAAYRMAKEIENTNILLRAATSDLMEAAAKAAGGDPAAIADYAIKEQRAALVMQRASELRADWAHGGHQFQKVMDIWDANKWLQEQMKNPDEGRTLFQLKQRAAALMQRMQSAEQAGRFAMDAQMTPYQLFRERLIAYFVNNLISGPITHMAYSVGNTVMDLYRAVPETAMQATVGAARGALGADVKDRVYFGEAGAQLYGLVRGARDGIGPAIAALKSGVAVLPGDPQGEFPLMQGRPQVLPGQVGYVLETPSRVVQGIHTLFYTMAYSQEIARLAYRDAAARGLEGVAFDAEVARLTSAPRPDVMAAASDGAMRSVLMKRPEYGGARYHLAQLVNGNLAAKLVMPFMQIGMNILQEGIVERTPLAMLSADARAELMGVKGGAARDLRIGKIVTGSMLGAVTVGLAAEGLMTDGGPVEPNKRRVLEDSGWKAYSIRIGDTYVPYRKFLGPLGPLVATAADFYEIGHTLNDEGVTKATAALGFGFSEVVADETWMAGLSSFIEAARNWDTKGEQYLRNTATSFLPFSSAMSQTARLVDPYQRQARTILEAAMNKVPGLSEALTPQIGIWGQPVASHMMISPTTANPDPVDQRLIALDRGIAPVERKILNVQLSESQYEDYARTAGQMAHMRLSAMVNAPGFSNLPDGVQWKAMEDIVSASRRAAAELIKMRNPEIIQQAMANKRGAYSR